MVKPVEITQIRLVACDIDGTLLQGEERALDPRLFGLIRRLAERGIRFSTASGRQYACQRRLFSQGPKEMFYICENGSAVFWGDEEISTTPIGRKDAVRMAEFIDSMPYCEALVSGPRCCYLLAGREDYLSVIRDQVGNDAAEIGGWEDIPEEIVKVTAYCRDGGKNHLAPLEDRWGAAYNVALSGEKWLDITRASKADGLLQVCRRLGIAPKEVMAFGDNYNDISILGEAGYPVAMAHSPEAVRNLAAGICAGRVEDELSRLLESLDKIASKGREVKGKV